MVTFMLDDRECTVPDSVIDIRSFRDWAHSDDFPEHGRIWWLQGRVWVDLSMEQVFSHVQVKTEFTAVLASLVKHRDLGLFLTDGVLLSNFAADISGEPDSLFISNRSVQEGAVRFLEGREEGYTELQGSPDMVLEIVSRSSIQKDTVILRHAYWTAGVREYWLVDARRSPLTFDLLRRTARGFQAVRKQDGWVKSAVFGHSFRLVRRANIRKLPEYSLEVRE
jgi:Uma2 family endonuclease